MKNFTIWDYAVMIGACILLAVTPMNGEFFYAVRKYGWIYALIGECIVVTFNTLIVFNLAWFVAEHRWFRRLPFVKRKIFVLLTLIVTFVSVNLLVKYLFTEKS